MWVQFPIFVYFQKRFFFDLKRDYTKIFQHLLSTWFPKPPKISIQSISSNSEKKSHQPIQLKIKVKKISTQRKFYIFSCLKHVLIMDGSQGKIRKIYQVKYNSQMVSSYWCKVCKINILFFIFWSFHTKLTISCF